MAGYTVKVDTYAGLRPDVSRLHPTARSLLVADAKATEGPGDSMTRARLLSYASAARNWVAAGFDVVFAVCPSPDPRGLWSTSVVELASKAGHSIRMSKCADLDDSTAVTAVSLC